MLFKRVKFTCYGQELETIARAGTGMFDNVSITPIGTDANFTLTTAQMAGGFITLTGMTAGRNITTPTAAAILAEAPDMDIGDSFMFQIANLVAFAGTWVAGAGVTLGGRATVPASANAHIIVTRTGAATVSWNSF